MRQPWNTINTAESVPVFGRRSWGTLQNASRARVGLGFHSVGDIEEETASLHNEMMQFGQELSDQLFLQDEAHRPFDIPKPGTPEERVELYRKVWRPLVNEWIKFHESHADSLWQNLPFSGAWDRIQDFRQRLIAIREEAKKKQFKLIAPDPIAPKRDPDLTKTVEGAVKAAAYVAVGIGGLLVLSILSKGSHSGPP